MDGVQGDTQDRNGDGDLLVAGDRGGSDKAAGLALSVDDGASVVLAPDAEASQREEAGSARLAAALEVGAADPGLAAATPAVAVLVQRNVGAANGATKDEVFLVHGVVALVITHGLSLIFFKRKTRKEAGKRC